ncbi:MAG: hypothetical protein ACRDZX_14550, partial [Acidimicrobiales bacterium]
MSAASVAELPALEKPAPSAHRPRRVAIQATGGWAVSRPRALAPRRPYRAGPPSLVLNRSRSSYSLG